MTEIVRGDSHIFEFSATDADGNAVNLTSVRWGVFRAGQEFAMAQSTESISGDTVTIIFAPEDTALLTPGRYLLEVESTNETQGVKTVQHPFTLLKDYVI